MEYSVEILQFSIQTVLKTYLLRHFNTFKQVNKREREREEEEEEEGGTSENTTRSFCSQFLY
jgi:hypothetical protein